MLLVAEVKKIFKLKKLLKVKNYLMKIKFKKILIPAVTHVDYSARVQTVHKDTNSIYYDLLVEFKKITNCIKYLL